MVLMPKTSGFRNVHNLNSYTLNEVDAALTMEPTTDKDPPSKIRGSSFTCGHKQRSCRPASFALAVVGFTFFISMALAIPSDHGHTHGVGSRHTIRGHHQHRKKSRTYLNQFAVNLLDGDENTARSIASRYGFVFKGQIATLEGWYLFEDKRVFKRSLHVHHVPLSSRILEEDPRVSVVDRQVVLSRRKRDQQAVISQEGPNDPAWRKMWYMHCGGVNNSVCPASMRISDAWRAGYTGEGIVVTILDDGIERNHPDLRLNYDANASYDINALDDDPMPRYDYSNENKHGTRCAGVVAAVSDNRICSVGIAYRAKIGGVRMLDGDVTDIVEAKSLSYKNQHIDIYSASWGPDDDGQTVEGPGQLAKAAFEEGARRGRDGKGSIFVWASGNGGYKNDACSCDGYINSIYTIGISSVSQNGKRPWYLESCASTLATTYSSGEYDEGKIITTDLRASCTYGHTGTSASAPMAAGVIALMLNANRNLTWRDVQHIIVRTSNPNGLQARDWTVNGAGYKVSHVFGFGLMDAARLTHVSESWKTVPEHRKCANAPHVVARPIRLKSHITLHEDAQACRNDANEVNYLEHVILRITLTHVSRRDLQIFLTSPAGTRSNLLEHRSNDFSKAGFKGWDFMTTHHWGENPQGLWSLEILDRRPPYRSPGSYNELRQWQLIFYGTRDHPQSNFFYNSCDAFPQEQCHSECVGCCGPTAMECRSCRHVSTFSGECITACPRHQFPHPTTNICQRCWKSCDECSAAYEDNCTACKIGFTLADGRCVKHCVQGSFLDQATQRCLSCHESCRTCAEKRDKCTSCRPGFEQTGNSCEASCPSGTFLLSYEAGCSFCHHLCLECTGAHQTHCTACADDMVLHRRRCINACPKRTYHDPVRQSCRPCHEFCKTCDGPSSNDCLSCHDDYTLREGECRRVCRDGFWSLWRGIFSVRVSERSKRSTRRGEANRHCAECDRAEQKSVCVPERYLLEGTCVEYYGCGDGHFGSDVTNTCEKCKWGCSRCGTFSDCLACEDGYLLYAGVCTRSCPPMTFSSKTGRCGACFFPCEACDGRGPKACTECRPGYFLNGRECAESCPKVENMHQDEASRTCLNGSAAGTKNDGLAIGITDRRDSKSSTVSMLFLFLFCASLLIIGFCVGLLICRFICHSGQALSYVRYNAVPLRDLSQSDPAYAS